MNRIIIEVEDPIIANSLAIWFETEHAIEAWHKSQAHIIENLIAEGKKIRWPDFTVVDFGETDRFGDVEHTITIELD